MTPLVPRLVIHILWTTLGISGEKPATNGEIAMTALAIEAEVSSLGFVGSVQAGEAIKTRRLQLGMTRTALAQRAGVDRSRVTKAEAGEPLRDSTLRAIEKALDDYEVEREVLPSVADSLTSVIELADGTRVTFTGSPETVIEAAHRFRQRGARKTQG